MAIPRRELRDHKCLRSGAHTNSYVFPQAMYPTSQHPHKLVSTASHCTTDKQPNRSTYPETTPGDADDRALCRDAQTTVGQSPYAGTHHGQQVPGRYHRGLPEHNARIALTRPLTHRPTLSRRGPHSANPSTTTTHTHFPRPKTPMQASLTPPGQAAHSQPIRPSYSFAQGGSQGNRGWPGHRHPKTTTQEAVPGDTEAQTPPRRA